MKTRILSLAIAALTISAQAQVIRPMPKSGPAPTVNLGKSSEAKLSNGLTLIVVENHKLPRVSATLSIDNKPVSLGAKKGADGLLSDILGTGTNKISKDAFNRKVEQLGARVSYNESGGRVSALSKYFNEVFGYFAEGAVSPKFDQAEFDASKARYIESLKSEEKNVESAASRVQSVIVYGQNHPFAEFDTEEKINAITLNDVKDYYNTYYRPDNAYLIFVGDITMAEAKKLAELHLGSWKKGNLSIADLKKVNEVSKTEIDVINMPNAVQSVVSVAYPVYLTKKDPDYYAVQIANSILGGDFNSKLNMNLREKHGWTYGARGGVSDSRYVGRFATSATVRNSVTDSAVVETIKEMRLMTQNKIDKKELDDVKAKFLGNFILSLERPETVASQALVKKTQGLSDKFFADYLQNINKVTVDDVLRVSKKYFRPDQARIVVTGKVADFGDKLEKLGYPVNYYDNKANKIAKPAAQQVDANTTISSVTDKYFTAIGGLANVQKIKSITTTASAKVQGMDMDMKLIQAKGAKMNMDMKMMGQTMQKIIFDGKTGYMEAQGQKIPLPADAATAMAKNTELFPELNFAKDKTYTLAGIEKYNGEDSYVIKGENATYYYDVKTGLKTGEVKTEAGQTVPTTYADYKDVSGVKMPYKFSQSISGMDIEFIVKDIKLNEATEADFK